MYSSVFAHETDTALRVRAANPPPPPGPPRHAAAGFWGAVLRAPASGALDAIESVARVAGGDPATAMRAARAGGRLPLLDQAAARERERTAAALGLDDRADPRTFVHGLRESLTPDPATTGSASMAVFQFGAFATQAIVAGAALGLPGGALATGLLAGEQEAWRLRQQGVDPEVARGAGAVRALVTGAAVALPVAGTTLRQSIGLVAAGGPAAFAIEQQGIRSILERADYREIAAHYDPMDLHGLIFSTLVPAGFAVGVHGGRALRRAGVPEDAARRQTEGAVAPAPDAALVPTPPQAAVDAAMTLHIARAVHESAPVRDLSDPVAQMAHRRALDEAEALFEAGEPVAPRSARIDPEFAARVEQEIADRLRVAARESAEEAGAVPVAERVEVEPVAAPERADAFLDQPTAIFLNERGEVVATTIREAIERADADVAQARLDARAFDVAVACALRSSVSR